MSIINNKCVVLYACINVVSLLNVYMLHLYVLFVVHFSYFDLCTRNVPMMFLLILFLSQ